MLSLRPLPAANMTSPLSETRHPDVVRMSNAMPSSDDHTELLEPYRPWLTLKTSMTQAIGQAFCSDVTVNVLACGTEDGAPWERRALNSSEPLFVRHIQLCAGTEPVALARTVTSATGPGRDLLTNLTNQPLAEVLFRDAAWQRGSEIINLLATGELPGRAIKWVRAGSIPTTLLVEEFFLLPLYTLATPSSGDSAHSD